MGYDMFLIKADKRKIRDIGNIYYEDIESAVISECNSYRAILRDFISSRKDIAWRWEEYNIVPESIMSDIISWFKDIIHSENWLDNDNDGRMTKYVYEEVKNWLPLKEHEVILFEEDA